jgi:hypothetical protein
LFASSAILAFLRSTLLLLSRFRLRDILSRVENAFSTRGSLQHRLQPHSGAHISSPVRKSV